MKEFIKVLVGLCWGVFEAEARDFERQAAKKKSTSAKKRPWRAAKKKLASSPPPLLAAAYQSYNIIRNIGNYSAARI
jgi:hypothetical protein